MKNLHLILTEKPSRLSILNSGKLNFGAEIMSSSNSKPQHIYITSDEEIKDGDWFLWKDTEDPYLFKCIGLTDTDSLQVENSLTKKIGTYNRDPKDSDYGDWYRCYSKKIILTTDQDLIKNGVQSIPDEFLEWFVKNPSCESVEVGYGWIRLTETDNEGYWVSIPDKQFEMQQEEPKQETLEEVAERMFTLTNDDFSNYIRNIQKQTWIAGAKWQQERMYNEKDMKLAFETGRNFQLTGEDNFNELIKQFKKK